MNGHETVIPFMRPAIKDPKAREAFDRLILQSALDGRHLPPHAEPGAPGTEATTAEIVPILLEAILEAHGREAWDAEAFEEVFLAALRAWHGDLDVAHRPDALVIRTRTCPIREEANQDQDARVCQMCRAMHARAAQETFKWRLRGLTFPRRITRGEDTCEVHILLAPAGPIGGRG